MVKPKKIKEKPEKKIEKEPEKKKKPVKWKVQISRQNTTYNSQDAARRAVINLLETGEVFYLSLDNVSPEK